MTIELDEGVEVNHRQRSNIRIEKRLIKISKCKYAMRNCCFETIQISEMKTSQIRKKKVANPNKNRITHQTTQMVCINSLCLSDF